MISRIYLKAPGERLRPPAAAAMVSLDGPGAAGLLIHHNLCRCLPLPQKSAPGVFSFLFSALGAWAADKLLPRSLAPDAWTRSIELHLPLSSAWTPLAPRLARLLNFLTGDEWVLKARNFAGGLNLKTPRLGRWQPEEVVLFSGGLDSLAGTLDRLDAMRENNYGIIIYIGDSYWYGIFSICN